MDHVREAHDVPPDIKSTSLDRFFQPWTIRRQIWTDALLPCRWCIITGCFVGGYHISFSNGTPWNYCEYSYCRCRPYSSVLCLPRLQAVRDLRETLAPGTGRAGPLRKHGGYRDESLRHGFGRSQCVNSPC